jgi:CBS domain-containing protein
MPSDETRTLLKRFGIAVTDYEDAVAQGAPPEQLAKAEAEARARLKDAGALVARLRGAAARPTTVEDVMTSDPLVMAPSARIEEAHALMKSRGFRHLPIVEGGKLVGIVSMTDIGRIGSTLPEVMARVIADVMTKSPSTIQPAERVEVAAAQMALRKINCLLVVSGEALVGIVTTYDLLDALARTLREH